MATVAKPSFWIEHLDQEFTRGPIICDRRVIQYKVDEGYRERGELTEKTGPVGPTFCPSQCFTNLFSQSASSLLTLLPTHNPV